MHGACLVLSLSSPPWCVASSRWRLWGPREKRTRLALPFVMTTGYAWKMFVPSFRSETLGELSRRFGRRVSV